MKYRIVIRNLLTKHVTPLTIYFDSKDYALERMKEYTSKLSSHLIYDLQSEEEGEA
jgi:hypothetical protein